MSIEQQPYFLHVIWTERGFANVGSNLIQTRLGEYTLYQRLFPQNSYMYSMYMYSMVAFVGEFRQFDFDKQKSMNISFYYKTEITIKTDHHRYTCS